MVMDNSLNIIYIGQQTFPMGTATSKRRRYMVDYLNNNGISNKVLITYYRKSVYKNNERGVYGKTEYVDINKYITSRHFRRYYKEGFGLLKEWYKVGSKNILIFPTVLNMFDFPFFIYGESIGYKIVFDQVETSYLLSGNLKWTTKIYYAINEFLSRIAYKKSSSFVISTALYAQNKKRYPNMAIELLPNSTPLLREHRRTAFNDRLKILYSGTYGEKEGVSYLIDGVLDAISKGCRCKLILLGKAPEKLKTEYSNNEAIEFMGFVSDEELINQLRDADVLAMVRTNTKFANYGFPFKLSEYLATGNVVIATKVGDVGNYLKDKESAYIVEPESKDEISNAIISICKYPKRALEIGENGYKEAEKHFSIDIVGKTFVDFLNRI